MKSIMTVQATDFEVTDAQATALVKEAWVSAGNKVKDMKSVEVYIKPEEKMLYYVINEEVKGSISL